MPVRQPSAHIDLVQHRVDHPRRIAVLSPSRRALLDAAEGLTAGGRADSFTPDQLREELAARGQAWSARTVKGLLSDEASTASGRLDRVRRGRYRLRTGPPGGNAEHASPYGNGASSAEHVLGALRQLAAAGQPTASVAAVTGELTAAGAGYSPRTVRSGLLALRTAQPALVRLGGDGLYRLTAAGQRLAATTAADR